MHKLISHYSQFPTHLFKNSRCIHTNKRTNTHIYLLADGSCLKSLSTLTEDAKKLAHLKGYFGKTDAEITNEVDMWRKVDAIVQKERNTHAFPALKGIYAVGNTTLIHTSFIRGYMFYSYFSPSHKHSPPSLLKSIGRLAQELIPLASNDMVIRDISPDNCIVQVEEGVPYLYLVDLGSSGRAGDPWVSNTTPAYSRPRSDTVTCHEDVYSLACLLFYMLEKEHYLLSDPNAYIARHKQERIQNSKSIPIEVKALLTDVLLKDASRGIPRMTMSDFSEACFSLYHLIVQNPAYKSERSEASRASGEIQKKHHAKHPSEDVVTLWHYHEKRVSNEAFFRRLGRSDHLPFNTLLDGPTSEY